MLYSFNSSWSGLQTCIQLIEVSIFQGVWIEGFHCTCSQTHHKLFICQIKTIHKLAAYAQPTFMICGVKQLPYMTAPIGTSATKEFSGSNLIRHKVTISPLLVTCALRCRALVNNTHGKKVWLMAIQQPHPLFLYFIFTWPTPLGGYHQSN